MTRSEEGILMSSIHTLGHSIQQGTKSIFKNRFFSLASIGTITACLFLFGIVFLIVNNLEYNVNEAQTNVGISVLFEKDVTSEQVELIGGLIEGRGEVESVTYISADQAWEDFKKDIAPEMVETFGTDNPLADSASYTVMLKDTSRQAELVNYIETLSGVRQVNRSDATAEVFTNFNKLVGAVSAVIIVLLVVVSIFLISITVATGISVRKEEIRIMKLIGATDLFVRGPFIVEGVIIGFIGSLIPLGILAMGYNKIIELIAARFSALALNFLPMHDVFRLLIPSCIGIGIGIGLLGSIITIRKHLRT